MPNNIYDEEEIEKIIHYNFKDKTLLKLAFTHTSFAFENKISSNERLEFLGDAVLSFVVADYLYKNYDAPEGEMTKWRSKIVSSKNLCDIIDALKLNEYLMVGGSFKNQDVTQSMKEDLFESLVGALYIDAGLEKTKKFILKLIDFKNILKQKDINYKSILQEEVQKVKGANMVYFTYEIPDKKSNFCAELYINDIFVCRSISLSKKQAQVDCAKIALYDKEKLRKIINQI